MRSDATILPGLWSIPQGRGQSGAYAFGSQGVLGSSLWLSLFPASPFTYPFPKTMVIALTGWAVSEGLYQRLLICGIFFSPPFY